MRTTLFNCFRRHFKHELEAMCLIIWTARTAVDRLERAMLAATPKCGSVEQPPLERNGRGWQVAVSHDGNLRSMWLHYAGPLSANNILEFLEIGGIDHGEALQMEDGTIQVTLFLRESVQRFYNGVLLGTLRVGD